MIKIDLTKEEKKITNFWNHIHFHPTDAIEDEWGKRILDEVSRDNVAKTVRMYTMFEDIVKKDENGKVYYDYSLNDERMDYMIEKGFDLLVIYAYLPPFMAKHPEMTSTVCKNKTRYKGKVIVVSEPSSYDKWEKVCYDYTCHIVERYGIERVKNWNLQCWNEPDIKPFFMGNSADTEEDCNERLCEYIKLYKSFAKGVKRVSEQLKIGNALAGRLSFLDGFLSDIKASKTPIDFICVHTYGTCVNNLNGLTDDGKSPAPVKPFNAKNTLIQQQNYEKIIKKYYPEKDVIVDEWGASAQGFYNREECPALMFREGSEFASYMCKMIDAYIKADVQVKKMLICLSGQHEMVVDFSGFRNFFTKNFIKKPIYNAYILLSKIGDTLLHSECDNADVTVLASKDENKTVIALAYASENFDHKLPSLRERIEISGISGNKKVTVYRIDDEHTNPYKLALRRGFGDTDYTEEELSILREEGEMKVYDSYESDFSENPFIDVEASDNALLLIEIDEVK